MSYGAYVEDPAERTAARNSFCAGVLLVAGIGNDNFHSALFPSAYGKTVCAVGAFFGNGRRWYEPPPFERGSNHDPAIDLAAPGGNLIATTHWGCRLSTNAYYDLSGCGHPESGNDFGGTSAATPVVSGVAALILGKYRAHGPSGDEALLGEDLYQTMIRSARHPGSSSGHTVVLDDSTTAFFDDSAGYGHVRADAALNFLASPRQIYHQRGTALSVVDTFLSVRTLLNIPGVPPDTYTVKTYVLRKAITFDPAFQAKPMAWVRSSGTAGVKNVDPYDYKWEVNWGRIVRVTATTCTLETNVFNIIRATPPYDWLPILPSKAAVALTTVGVPSAGGGGGAGPGVRERDAGEGGGLPRTFALHQNRPNPFEQATTIRFEVPARAAVRLDVFDAQGRLVRTLANAEFPAGFHAASWDRCDSEGRVVKPGIYLYRLRAGRFNDQKKMVLLAR